MVKPKVLLFPGEDTPEQKPPSPSTEDQTRERVYGSENMVMGGDSVESDVTELNSEGDSLEKREERLRVVEMKEKEIGLLEESVSRRLSVLEEKEIESDLRLVIEASIMRLVLEKQSEDVVTHLKTQENKLGLLLHSTTKKLEDLMSEFDGKKEEACRIFKKFCELEKAEKEFEMKQRAETERRNKESEAREKELRVLEESVKEKTAELKRKEEAFELKLKEEADRLGEETELMKKGLEIKEKALEERLKELELKQMELEERSRPHLVEAESRKRSNLEIEPPLLVKNDSDADSLTPQAKKQKSQEANDGDVEGIVCTDETDEDPKPLTCLDTKFSDFSKSMSSFAVDQVWALYDPRDDMPRTYAQIREIFDSQLSLQVTLLEPVKTTTGEQSILSGCRRFEYGDTEIKSHLMFAHEMDHIKCAENVIVNPRKGETWALFRDWNASWNSQPDLHEPPYRYDFVEVISEFDDLIGILVAYMGRVEGFESVFNRAEQHGYIKIVIPPGEMQKFSHKVESVKLSGKEEEGIPFTSFKLNPAAIPRYFHVLEEVVETKIQIKAPTVVHQNGSTKDLPIIID
ncbi:hypothetical protein ISN45_Aa07g013300 [Arabidopsis thaliana x Arabidopsis arenosa]|uniref:DUF3444 domain-containing protein n=1 Tax=Arabidopsis thaliana x Arabidopsis arenosa TaxID=1240361 RepID=A0A8T1Y1P8_9BRAS|nr:hypothetical protein ISN45_Aa07g013300 [Arabidopsis thaliana x Arabidopsis arenosa]